MHRLLARGLLTAMMASAAVSASWAQNAWYPLAGVSSTHMAKQNQLCIGMPDGTKENTIGCPAYAPSVTTSGNLIVSGTVSATQFIGDGSLLTGVGASTDRIISGTSRVVVNSATNAISFTTNGVERMVINSAGNVGIGTSAPGSGYALDVVGTGNMTSGVSINGMGALSRSGSYLTVNGTTAANSGIIFNTTGSVERMRIEPSGTVGIGTNAPSTSLHIVRAVNNAYQPFSTTARMPSTSNDAVLRIENLSGINNNAAYLELVASNGIFHHSYIASVAPTGSSFSNLVFGGRTGGNSYSEFMRINRFGEVGIGTTNPARTLDVSGTARIASDTTVSGTIQVGMTPDSGCSTSTDFGKIRRNPVTGNMELCGM